MLQALQRRNMVRCDKPHGIKAAIVTSTQQHVYINRNALEMNVVDDYGNNVANHNIRAIQLQKMVSE